MDLEELDERIDRLSIQQQLELLGKNLSDSQKKLEIANILWARVVAAEELFNSREWKLYDTAADRLLEIRSLIGVGN
jgi:hypothetical protein